MQVTAPPLAAEHDPRPGQALGVLLIGAVIIASTPILFRLSQTGPAAAGFWRLVFALPFLAPMGSGRRRVGGLRPSAVLVLAGAAFAGDLACWHYALLYTTVANATVLSNLAPVVVTLGAWMLWRERPSGAFLVGMATAIAGATMMTLAKAGGGPPTAHHLGDSLAVGTAAWYGLYFLSVRKARSAHGARSVMLWTSLVGAPILILLAVLLGEPLTPSAAGGWIALVALGVAHALGQGSIAWSLGRLPAATAAVVVLVQPVAAAGLAFFVLGEAVSLPQALAGAAALAGIAFAIAGGNRAPAASDRT